MIRTATILVGFAALYLVLDRFAAGLGSFRGEWGVIVCVAVVVLAIFVEMVTSWTGPQRAALLLGLGRSSRGALAMAVGLSLLLVAFFPIYAMATDVTLTVRPDWWLLVAGLFAQAGIAEETVFRGYLFRHFREGRSFWRAAVLSAIPFVLVHLALFVTMEFAIALTSLLVALSLSFPLAWLYERGSNSIWPPAILHFIIQGAIKLVAAPDADFITLAIWWMGLTIVAAWAVFALRPVPADAEKSEIHQN